MERDNKTDGIFGKREFRFRQKLGTFMFFLLLAFVFWLLNALNQNYSTNIRFPIKYIHHHSDREMTPPVPSEIYLNVSGHGYTLLRSMLTARNNPVLVRVISLNLIEVSRSSGKYLLHTRTLFENVQRQLPDGIGLNYISPDTLAYYFSPVVRKKVPVKADLLLDFEKQFMQGDEIIVQPDSVFITGPALIIDTIRSINTLHRKESKINKAVSFNVDLEKITGISSSVSQVNITVPVEKFTETSIWVPVKVLNVPESFFLKTFPSRVKLNVLVPLKYYNRLSPESFIVAVDYKSTFSSINNKIKVNVLKHPSFARVTGFSPLNVEYIIESPIRKPSIKNASLETDSVDQNN